MAATSVRKTLTFSIAVVILIFLCDRGLALLFDYAYLKIKTGQTGGKINYYLSLPQVPSLLVMGNSRAMYQVIPDSLEQGAFNLGHAGMSQVFQTGLISVLADADKMPDRILLHLEPNEFTSDGDYKDIQNLKYYFGKNKVVTEYIDQLSSFERFKFVFALYKYNGRAFTLLKNFIQSTFFFQDSNGYEMVAPSPDDSVHTIYSARGIQNMKDVKLDKRQIACLLKFIQYCHESNTELVCFTSPFYQTPANFNEITAQLNEVLAKEGVEYINFTDHQISELTQAPTLWKDASHLNHWGAQIESGALKAELRKLLKSQERP